MEENDSEDLNVFDDGKNLDVSNNTFSKANRVNRCILKK